MGHGRCCDPQIRRENEKMRRRDSACKQRIMERVRLIVEKGDRERANQREKWYGGGKKRWQRGPRNERQDLRQNVHAVVINRTV